METQPDSPPVDPKPPVQRRWYWAIVRRILISLLVGYLMIWVFVMIFESAFIYFPLPYPAGEWQPRRLAFEDAWFQSADGTKLHGWYVPHPEPKAHLLFCHGNAGNLSHRVDMVQVLNQSVGASVLIFDYRGYGRSEGKPSEAGILADARAARAWMAEQAKIEESEIVLMGRSLGGAVAVDLAAEDSARALVLESTFTSIPDMAAVHYRWLPVRRMLRTRFNSLQKISAYDGPLLQSHGDADTIIPFEQGKQLFDAANEPKRLYVQAGGDHNDFQDTEYYEVLIEFLDGL